MNCDDGCVAVSCDRVSETVKTRGDVAEAALYAAVGGGGLQRGRTLTASALPFATQTEAPTADDRRSTKDTT